MSVAHGRSNLAARRGRITTRLEERDDYGIVLFLILATIMTISLGAGAIGQFVGVCLSGTEAWVRWRDWRRKRAAAARKAAETRAS